MAGGGRHPGRGMLANKTKQAEVTYLRDATIVDEYIQLIWCQDMLLCLEITYWFQISVNELYSTGPWFVEVTVDHDLGYVKGV